MNGAVAIVMSVLLVIVFIIGALALIKNEVTCRNHIKIIDAIYEYSINSLNKDFNNWQPGQPQPWNLVDTSDMENYDATLYRFWDWGYTRILPPDKFELIRPFIK